MTLNGYSRTLLVLVLGVIALIALDTMSVIGAHGLFTFPTLSEGRSARYTTDALDYVPYEIVLEEWNYYGPDTQKTNGRSTVAQRSDGAFVQLIESFGATRTLSQGALYMEDGEKVMFDAVTGLKSSRMTMSPIVNNFRDPASECTEEFSGTRPRDQIVGHETIQGYATNEFRWRDDTAVTSMWLAPSLGCATLKIRTEFVAGSRWEGLANEKIAALVLPGEPDASLFTSADGYEEVPPSTLYKLNPADPAAREMDELYYNTTIR